MRAETQLQKARVQLVLHQPFFASIVFNRPITISDTMPSACIDLSGRITLGRKFIEKMSISKIAGLLAHEAMHHALQHGMRRGWRKHKPFNIAADKVINDILKESGMDLPEEGVFRDGAREFTAEQLYAEGEGEGEGEGYSPGTGNDDLSDEGAPNNPGKQADEIGQELAQAVQAARSQGKMPVGLSRLIDKVINPKTPWHTLLRTYMTHMVKADISWARPRKNRMNIGYFPSADKKPTIGMVAIIGDSSGSIGQKEIAHFVGHMNSIMESCAPEKVYFLHVDSEVHRVDEFGPEDLPLNITKIEGGGGSDMGAGIRWLQENGVEPDVCVILTDGYCAFGQPPLFPVVTLCTTDKKTPFGETIFYEIGEMK